MFERRITAITSALLLFSTHGIAKEQASVTKLIPLASVANYQRQEPTKAKSKLIGLNCTEYASVSESKFKELVESYKEVSHIQVRKTGCPKSVEGLVKRVGCKNANQPDPKQTVTIWIYASSKTADPIENSVESIKVSCQNQGLKLVEP